MQITLNVDEKLFNESGVGMAIQNAFDSMPDEDKKAIVTDIVRQHITESKVVKRFFVDGSYRYANDTPQPTHEFRKIIESIDFSKELEAMKDQILGFVTEPHQELLVNMIVEAFMHHMAEAVFTDSKFKDLITQEIMRQGGRFFERKQTT